MKLPPYVKSKTVIGNFIPIIGNATSQSLYPFIFLSKKVYDDLKSDKPSPKSIAHLAHEETHFKRQKEIGPLLFNLNYFFNPKFRFREELEADIGQMKVYKKHGIHFDIDKRAKLLSGYLYLWSNNYTNAKKELEKAWKEI